MRLKPALLAFLIALAAAPAVAQAAPPQNNNYLPVAVVANSPGSVFPHNSPVQWTIPGNDAAGDIDEATVQGNMGDPASTPENTTCPGLATFDRTVWYWVHPDVSGWIRVTTSGGDAVIRIITVAGNNTPNFSDSACADDPTDISNEELFTGITGGPGRKYAVQVGVFSGFGSWTLQHLTRITFFRDRDLDTVFDPSDRCATTRGPASTQGCPDSDGDGVVDIDDRCATVRGPAGALRGCPDGDGDGIANIDDRCASENSNARDANRNGCLDLRKFGANIVSMPNTTLFSLSRGRFVRNGVRITSLTVGGLPAGTRVQVSCSRRSICRKQTKRGKRVKFGKLKGKRLRPGRRVVVRVSKSGYVTRRFVIKARKKGRRGVSRSNRCVVPGTKRLASCSRVSTIR